MNEILPMYDENSQTADLGVLILGKKIVSEFKWVFREQVKNDLGIDCQIEIVTNEKSKGRIIAAQLKTGKSFFKFENPDSFTFYGEPKHLNYWLNHSLPIILILCNEETEICYWVEVTNSNTIKTPKSWKINVPKNQIISRESINKLNQISITPKHEDIIELLLYRFIHEKYTKYSKFGQISICNSFELPRDFYYFDFLGKFEKNEEFVYITYYYDVYQSLTIERLMEYIENRKICMSALGEDKNSEYPFLLIFLISNHKQNLILDEEITKILESQQNIIITKLLYTYPDHSFSSFDIIELDEKNNEISLFDYY